MNTKLYDLHLHTTASDGADTPSEVISKAKAQGLVGLAITDHDTMAGLNEAEETARALGILLVPGVEWSAGEDGEIHILAYGVSPTQGELMRTLESLRALRMERMLRMLEKVTEAGFPIAFSDLKVSGVDSLGRPHVAETMVRLGYVATIREAFSRYLAAGKPCYVPKPCMQATETISLLREGGAVPVLAHPGRLHMGDEALTNLLPTFCKAGLMGLEAFHPSHAPNAARAYERMAQRHQLLVTGGSDCHGSRGEAAIGEGCAFWTSAEADVQLLLEAMAKSQAK